MELPKLMQDLSTGTNKTIFKTYGADIDNTHTEFVWGDLDNCVILMVTQFGKVGSLVVTEKEHSLEEFKAEDSYDIKHLLGTGNIENQVAARFLVEQLKIKKTFYLFSSLKENSAETLKAVRDICTKVFIA